MSAAPACPEHGTPDDPAASFCETCGRNLRTGALPAPRRRPGTTAPQPGTPGTQPSTGSAPRGAPGRRPQPGTADRRPHIGSPPPATPGPRPTLGLSGGNLVERDLLPDRPQVGDGPQPDTRDRRPGTGTGGSLPGAGGAAPAATHGDAAGRVGGPGTRRAPGDRPRPYRTTGAEEAARGGAGATGPAGADRSALAEAAGREPVPDAGFDLVSARQGGGVCAACGAAGDVTTGWCGECGRRLSAARERDELTLDGVAAVTDRAGRRYNEDAVAIGRADGAVVAVVCDGISSSRRADAASTDAAEAGAGALLAALAAGTGGREATLRAAVTAAGAAAAVGRPEDGDAPPGCTYVSVAVAADGVTVGWVGDSRAYWVGADGDARQLTLDDSIAAIRAAGLPVPDGLEHADPDSRALIRWLGADAGDVVPQVVHFVPDRAGWVVACSDGLSHYLPAPADLATAIRSGPTPPATAGSGPPPGATTSRAAAEAVPAGAGGAEGAGEAAVDVAARLTRLAIEAGGHDNIAVAVIPVAGNGVAAETRRSV